MINKNQKIKFKMISSIVLILLIVIFAILRLASVFESFYTAGNEMINILNASQKYSHSQKMEFIFGSQYTFYENVIQNTPTTSVVYFPKLPFNGMDRRSAVYFLYPRRVIVGTDSPDDITVFSYGDYYLALVDKFPEFVVDAEEIIIFGEKEDKITRINGNEYDRDKYLGAYGLIKLNN